MKTIHKKNIRHSILPPLFCSALTGALVGVGVALFKVGAEAAISHSEKLYAVCKTSLPIGIAVLLALAGFAGALSWIYKKVPNARGGGIPTAIGIVRGEIRFNWWRNLLASFGLSLTSFFAGIPLGTEGPSVLIGTAMGRGVSCVAGKKHAAWDRYIVTGGACAGFTAATGAPVSGILFGLEEAHQRISPLVLTMTAASAAVAKAVSDVLSPLLGVESRLFAPIQTVSLSAKELWIPILVGLLVGVYSLGFLRYYKLLNAFFRKKLKRVPAAVKILFVFVLTFLLGAVSYTFISTGHGLIDTLLHGGGVWYLLLAGLLVRATLMILASSSGITGGLFLPILALGAMVSALLGKLMITYFGLSEVYYSLIVVLGICASIAGMMKTPLIAILFAFEVLSAANNVLPVVLAASAAYLVTELFYADSINDHVLEHRVSELHEGKTAQSFDAQITVQNGSFAVGKQIRDILWPSDLRVLSLKKVSHGDTVVDAYGEKILRAGDELHVRYLTYDHAATQAELTAMFGEQTYAEEIVETV